MAAESADVAEKREDLMVAHRLTALYGLDELSWNHISARTSQGFLITPGNRHYLDVSENDFSHIIKNAKDGLENETGDIIHSAVYDTRPDVGAVVHTHAPNLTAVACLRDGLQIYDQSGALFHNDVAYYDWHGISLDRAEHELIAAAVKGGAMTLMMRNHGACTFGKTVAEAWVRMYYLERTCQLQLKLLQSGAAIHPAPPTWMAHTARLVQNDYPPGMYEWKPLKRWVLTHFRTRDVSSNELSAQTLPTVGQASGHAPSALPGVAKL
eukprot:m.120623 g.120623  ORF g.120623 m.120623 type:complete len:268 (+) comp17245_c0_seq1:240-1043(+)